MKGSFFNFKISIKYNYHNTHQILDICIEEHKYLCKIKYEKLIKILT